MDLRTQKTLSSIKNTFLQLRAQKPLEQITIKELTERAMISKGTFYLHYKDLYDLSEHLQNEVISDLIQSLRSPEEMLSDPAGFCLQLIDAFRCQQALIDILFSGTQVSVLAFAVENALKEYLFRRHPQLRYDHRFNMLVTFEVQGGYYAYSCHSDEYPFEEILDTMKEALASLPPLVG